MEIYNGQLSAFKAIVVAKLSQHRKLFLVWVWSSVIDYDWEVVGVFLSSPEAKAFMREEGRRGNKYFVTKIPGYRFSEWSPWDSYREREKREGF